MLIFLCRLTRNSRWPLSLVTLSTIIISCNWFSPKSTSSRWFRSYLFIKSLWLVFLTLIKLIFLWKFKLNICNSLSLFICITYYFGLYDLMIADYRVKSLKMLLWVFYSHDWNHFEQDLLIYQNLHLLKQIQKLTNGFYR